MPDLCEFVQEAPLLLMLCPHQGYEVELNLIMITYQESISTTEFLGSKRTFVVCSMIHLIWYRRILRQIRTYYVPAIKSVQTTKVVSVCFYKLFIYLLTSYTTLGILYREPSL